MIALETRNLNKSFGSQVIADDISLKLPQGARHALIGPNGPGKTTLINITTGTLKPDSGQVLLGDQDITNVAPYLRIKQGLVRTFQINTLFPKLTPLESLAMAICERTAFLAIV